MYANIYQIRTHKSNFDKNNYILSFKQKNNYNDKHSSRGYLNKKQTSSNFMQSKSKQENKYINLENSPNINGSSSKKNNSSM